MTLTRRQGLAVLAGASAALAIGVAGAEPRTIMLAATTSTENSGLLGHLLPRFEAASGIEVRAVTAGTGAVLKLAERGDVDVVLVHSRIDEQAFVAAGFGIDRRDVMFNDFVIVGPGDDPAGIARMHDPAAALRRIAEHQAVFLSRGDDSGTHKAELRLWAEAGIDSAAASGDWYRESGAGQGATLNIATNLGAYALTDRATWLSFHNRGDLDLLVEGGSQLHNPYGVIRVNPERFPAIDAEAALAFVDWLTSAAGQAAIRDFRIDGTQVFFPHEEPSG